MGKSSNVKDAELRAEVIKLQRYINQYVSRTIKVENALGKKGCKFLNKIIDLSGD